MANSLLDRLMATFAVSFHFLFSKKAENNFEVTKASTQLKYISSLIIFIKSQSLPNQAR